MKLYPNLLLSLSLLTPVLSHAALLTADLRSSNVNLTQNATNANNLGNSWQLVINGITITMTAFNIGADGGSTFQPARLIPYSSGLGVCNSGEISNCGSDPQHRVDNNGSRDFVLFQFSAPVDVTSVTLTASWNSSTNTYRDTDASYWLKDADAPVSLTGSTLANMNLGSQFTSDSSSSVSSRTFNIPDNSSDLFLIAARVDHSNDYFKIKTLTFEEMGIPPSEVPEPGTYATLGVSLIAFAFYKRRKSIN